MLIYLQSKIVDFFYMKRRVAGKFVCYLLFNCLVVIPLNVLAQQIIQPINKPILLSGNFGELRATHFHSGIDIRTGGVEGLPVICVKEGRLVRVSVSPTGYGQALYIEHPDGTTTVYGHLQRFVSRITEIVRELQYRQESFRIDADFRPFQLFFRQGDTIAYSGNSGSSGGPHLHFEVRNTLTEHTLNPLHYYQIRDLKAPVVRRLYLYAISEEGCVELLRQCPLKVLAAGRYAAGRITVPSGKIGVGVYTTDYMNDSWNKLGVYQLTLKVNAKDTLFHFHADSCSFDQNIFINDIKDFEHYKKKETVYRCFGNFQYQLLGVQHKDRGEIEVAKDSVVRVSLELADINGNQSQVSLELKGRERKKTVINEEDLFRYDRGYTLDLPGGRLEIEKGCLLSSVEKYLKVEEDTLTGRHIYVLARKEVPLLKKARLTIRGEFTERSLICEMGTTGCLYPVETIFKGDSLQAEIGYLSRYVVVEDQTAPEIMYRGKFPDRTLRFTIKDDLAGIASYRGEVNGQWCLFTYDPRVNLLQCDLAEPVFQRGKINVVTVCVEDQVGNSRQVTVKLPLN